MVLGEKWELAELGAELTGPVFFPLSLFFFPFLRSPAPFSTVSSSQ